jgi:hypothetical protein
MKWLKLLRLRSNNWKKRTWVNNDVPFLIDVFHTSKSPEYKRRAVTILGEIRDDSALEVLTISLISDDYFLRREAAIALGKIGSNDVNAVNALTTALDTEDYYFNIEIVNALTKIGSKDSITKLIIAYAKSRGRNGALSALCVIDKNWEKTAQAHKAVPELERALSDRNVKTSWEAYDAKVVGYLRRNYGSTREGAGNQWQMEECKYEMFLRAACMLEAIEGGKAEKYLTPSILDLMSEYICDYVTTNEILVTGNPGASKRDRIIFDRCEGFRRALQKLKAEA